MHWNDEGLWFTNFISKLHRTTPPPCLPVLGRRLNLYTLEVKSPKAFWKESPSWNQDSVKPRIWTLFSVTWPTISFVLFLTDLKLTDISLLLLLKPGLYWIFKRFFRFAQDWVWCRALAHQQTIVGIWRSDLSRHRGKAMPECFPNCMPYYWIEYKTKCNYKRVFRGQKGIRTL